MNESIESSAEGMDAATLDPPGSIAVVGAGPLGIEAALYGRYLGYEVTLIESETVGHSLMSERDRPLPMLPARCISPLALSAIEAQNPDAPPMTLPTTIAQWIDQVLVPLTQTDLLRDRLRCPFRVTNIQHVHAEPDDAEDEVPPDFRLTLAGVDGQSEELDAESVIVAIGSKFTIPCEFSLPCDYFFRIGETSIGDAEQDLRSGLKQIVDLYAALAGRATLDLYRPMRM